MTQHAPMSPSRLHQIIGCPGSYKLCQEVGEKPQSDYAAEGTLLHEYAEQTLVHYLGGENGFPEIEELDHRLLIDEAVAFVRNTVPFEAIHGHEAHTVLEKRVYVKPYEDLINGTLDFGSYVPGIGIYIMDFKFGFHHVHAFDNPQLLAYLVGFIDYLVEQGFDPEVLDKEPKYIGIIQPRVDHFEVEYVSNMDIRNYLLLIERAVRLADQPYAPFRASEDNCKWCAAAGTCRANMTRLAQKTIDTFAVVAEIKEGKRLVTKEELCGVLEHKDFVTQSFKQLEELVFQRLLAKEEMPGFKLVHGRSSRSWNAGTTVDDLLIVVPELEERIGELVETKLLSPAKVEKLIPKKLRDGLNEALVTKTEGKLTLAKSTSSKAEVTLNDAVAAFKGIAETR